MNVWGKKPWTTNRENKRISKSRTNLLQTLYHSDEGSNLNDVTILIAVAAVTTMMVSRLTSFMTKQLYLCASFPAHGGREMYMQDFCHV